MRPIPPKLKAALAADPEYKVCAKSSVAGHNCDGRITWEHAIIYAGRQLNERWAIIPICAYAHSVDFHQDGGDLDKQVNMWIALNRASEDELRAVSKATDYLAYRDRLNQKYGRYVPPLIPKSL